MKKLVFFLVIVFILQVFCANSFGQNTITGNPINFNIPGLNGTLGLQMKTGMNSDFVLYFPLDESAQHGRWNRIIAKDILSFTTGDRGLSVEESDLFIQNTGYVGIGSTSPSEKLTVNGNILASEYKLNTGGGLYKDPRGFVGLYANTLATLDFYLNTNEKPSLTMLKPYKGSQYPILAMYPKGRIVASGGSGLEFAGGDDGIENGDAPPHMIIKSSGNIGMGTTSPNEKLTVNGNIRLENNGKLIGAKELEVSCDSLMFNMKGLRGLQMKRGSNGDFTLYFPNPDNNSKWNRIIAKNQLSFNAGNRGVNDNDNVSDLHISVSGNVGIGIVRPNEKLTVAGNLKIDKDKNGNNSKLFINANPDSINAIIKNKYSAFITGGVLSEDFAIGPKSSWADHVFNSDYPLQSLNEVESYIQTHNRLPDMPSAAEVQKNGYTLHDMNVKLLQKVEELTLYSIEQNKEIEQLKKVVSSYETLLEKVNQLENKISQ
jgi:hypothetical protein